MIFKNQKHVKTCSQMLQVCT